MTQTILLLSSLDPRTVTTAILPSPALTSDSDPPILLPPDLDPKYGSVSTLHLCLVGLSPGQYIATYVTVTQNHQFNNRDKRSKL
ncbi:hypothetical protein FKM82_024617 [Ascaphus truei]